MIVGVAGVALFAGAACVVALIANDRANRLAEVAKTERDSAEHNATEAEHEREAAKAAETAAQHAEKRGREFRYATDMQLAARLIGDQHANARQVLDRLADHEPGKNPVLPGDGDLRGFEWYYLKRLVDSRATIFPSGEQPVTDSALSAAGELVTLDEDGRLKRWDVKTRRETRAALELRMGRGLGATALSPDGGRVAVASAKQVHLVDTATGADVMPPLPAQSRFGIIFSPDNQMLVTLDSTIGWWDAATGKSIATQHSRLLEAGPLSISADGLTVAVSGPGWCSVFRMNAKVPEISVLLDKQDANMGSTRTAAISPDGRSLLVSEFHTGTVALFDISSGKSVMARTFDHAASVSAIGFDLKGTAMATACLDGSLKIWPDFKGRGPTGTPAAETTALMGHRDEVTRIGFAAGGKQVISCSRDMTTRLWDLTQKAASVHRTLDGVVSRRVRFSPDGLLIAAAEVEGGRIRLRDAETGRSVRELPVTVEQGVYPDSVAFSPDNRLLAVGYGGMPNVSYIELWEIDRGERLAVLPGTTDIPNFNTTGSNGTVSSLCFTPDGKFLAAGFGAIRDLRFGKLGNSPLKVYDVARGRTIRMLPGHENYCTSVTFSRDGSRMASASNDGTARIWDTATWKTLHILPNPFRGDLIQKIFHDAAFSPAGDLLALASHDGTVQVWNAMNGELVQTLRGHANGVTSVAFSPDGHTLASGSYESSVRLWNVATWREVMRLDPEVGLERHSLEFSPDGTQLLATGSPAILWSTRLEDEISPEQGAEQLSELLDSKADFTSRFRMLSENSRWHEALEVLVGRRPDDTRVQGALAAARANRHASRQEWKQAAREFDQLKTTPPRRPEAWFRTPGLLRLATALLHENRPSDAALLLQGGAARRAQDGLAAIPAKASLRADAATGEMLFVLLAALEKRLAESPGDPSLLELRAELAGQWSDSQAQVADYTAALSALAKRKPEPTADLKRLYGRRGNAQVDLRHWQQAVDDYALAGIDATTQPNHSTVIGSQDPWTELAAAYQLKGDQRAIDQLVERQPKLAGQIGDLFGREPIKEWARAIEIYNKGITAETTDAQLLSKRACAHEAQKNWEAASTDWSRAADGNPNGARLLGEFARRLGAGGLVPLADREFEKSQALYERALEADPENSLVATELAQLLLNRYENGRISRWTVLQPTEMKSEGGATLARQQDDSVLATGANPDNDVYVIGAEFQGRIGAIRLEAIPDPSMPAGGSGRAPTWGNFVLTDFRVMAGESLVAWSRAEADFSQQFRNNQMTPFPIAFAIDGDESTGWAIWPRVGEPHWAVFIPSQPLSAAGKTRLTVRLAFRSKAMLKYALGRFRLSVTDSATAFEDDQRRLAKLKTSNPLILLAAAYAQQGKTSEAAIWAGKALDDAGTIEARTSLLEPLGDFDDVLAELRKPRQDDLALRLAQTRSLARRGIESVEEGRRDRALPELKLARKQFTELLEKYPEPEWTVLKPIEIKSQGGATLATLEDGSILAGGENQYPEVYTLVARPGLEHISAIRLEALPDPSFPRNGPGRCTCGNFFLNELRLFSNGKAFPLSDIIVADDEAQEFPKSHRRADRQDRGLGQVSQAGREAYRRCCN